MLQMEENSCLAVCQRPASCRAVQQCPSLEPAVTLVKPPELPKKPPDNVALDVPEYLQELYGRCRKNLSRMMEKAVQCLLYFLSILNVLLAGSFDFRLCVILKHHDDRVKHAVSSLTLRRPLPHRVLRAPPRPPHLPARLPEMPARPPEPPDRPPEPPNRPPEPHARSPEPFARPPEPPDRPPDRLPNPPNRPPEPPPDSQDGTRRYKCHIQQHPGSHIFMDCSVVLEEFMNRTTQLDCN